MQLYYSPASPFARMVRVLAHETGLADRIELVNPGMLTPVDPNDRVIGANPLGKIPTLVLEDGSGLNDSRVICEYLDGLHDGPKMIPADGRFRVLTRQALAVGLLDTAVGLRYETFLRPEEKRWPQWIEQQQTRMDRVLDEFAAQRRSGELDTAVDVAAIATGCALAYLDFRFADRDWRPGREPLADWYQGFGRRESMHATLPE